MKILADTHALIWWLVEVERLSPAALDAMSDPANTVLVSAVTGYEIELKRPQSALLQRLPSNLEIAVAAERFQWLPVLPAHAIEAGRLPRHHGDPWDRILVSQARLEGAVMVTNDRWMSAYGIEVLS